MSEVTDCLHDLVRIPSPNPPGDTRDVAVYIAERLKRSGCRVQLVAPPEKPSAVSVIATIGVDGGTTILYHAHIDTVPVATTGDWTVDPLEGIISNGRLYGRGSVDDKGPLAAMIVAFEKLARHALHGRLILVAAAEEEVGGQLGTRWLAETNQLPPSDFVVVGEQTNNRVATANKGVMRATIRTSGQSVHATNPDRGINAIEMMAKVVLALGGYHRSLSKRTHPLIGVPTCNVGTIRGGIAVNMVPDYCEIQVDRRMLPGETADAVQQELRAVVSELDFGDRPPEVGEFLLSAAFESQTDNDLTQAFLATVESILQDDPGPVGYLPGSDAKHLVNVAQQGMVVFGPGTYEMAHIPDEYIEIAELEQATHILYEFALGILSQEGI